MPIDVHVDLAQIKCQEQTYHLGSLLMFFFLRDAFSAHILLSNLHILFSSLKNARYKLGYNVRMLAKHKATQPLAEITSQREEID